MYLQLTYNPKCVVFDLLGEPLVLIHPPIDAVGVGVVWKYGLPWPHLGGRECDMMFTKKP